MYFDEYVVKYKDVSTGWLLEAMNTSSDDELRLCAVSGLMRALLDTPGVERTEDDYLPAVQWISDAILGIQTGNEFDEIGVELSSYLEGLPAVEGKIDFTSRLATSANHPRASAAIIEHHIPRSTPKLIIGLGHGGILSSLATYNELQGEKYYYPVRFSTQKRRDLKPAISYPEEVHLRRMAAGSAVIIHDEDRSSGKTMQDARRYIDKILQVDSYGYTPTVSWKPDHFRPEISGRRARLGTEWARDYFGIGLHMVLKEQGIEV